MSVQFLSNEKGKVVAVQMPVKEWQEIERKLEVYNIASSIKQGLKEVELIERGEIKPKRIEDLLNEL